MYLFERVTKRKQELLSAVHFPTSCQSHWWDWVKLVAGGGGKRGLGAPFGVSTGVAGAQEVESSSVAFPGV